MVRKPSGEKPSSAPTEGDREKIIEAFMALLAERPFEELGFGDIAARAGVRLTQCRNEFGSTFDVLAAQVKATDRQVLASAAPDMAEEPPRERLFDLLMRRLELLAPHRAAIRSLLRSARRNPGLAFAMNRLAVRSQQWMLTAADIDASGRRGAIRAQGLALLYARVVGVWLKDEDPGLARTLAALDRELARGQRCARLLDDLCRFVPPRCGRRHRSRRPEHDGGNGADVEPIVA